MKIPKEVQCRTCSQVFCCAKCREKHEDQNHKEIKAIRQICYICNSRPFPLRIDTKITPSNLLIEHILKEHLPLRCNRCTKIFHTAADFKSISRCLTNNDRGESGAPDVVCQLEGSDTKITTIKEVTIENVNIPVQELENKENVNDNCSVDSSDHSAEHKGEVRQTAIKIVKASTATLGTPQISKEVRAISDPIEDIGDINKAMLTPLSMINLRWKRKSRQSFDSMLCTTSNISAVNASSEDGPFSPNKKLVRTTSTPMMHGCLLNRKTMVNESYTSAIGHMSSIRHSNSSSESESKPGDPTPPSSASYEIPPKLRGMHRSRSRVLATPLRQVMSKSIQRAIAQHGYYSKILAPRTQRKMSFNSTNSSGLNSTSDSSLREAALDLRTTPVLKRASSESAVTRIPEFGPHRTTKLVCSPKKINEESSWAKEASSNYHDARQTLETSSEIIDQENRDNQRIDEESLIVHRRTESKTSHNYQDTPKVTGGILKKAITFATPEMSRLKKCTDDDLEEDKDEIWATPCAVPRSFSCSALLDSRLDSIMTEDNSEASGSDDVFMPPSKTISAQQHKLVSQPIPSTGRLWTIVTNVVRLASRSDIQDEFTATGSAASGSSEGDGKVSSTLLKKAASFAGFLKDHFPVPRAIRSQSQRSNSSSGSEEFAVPRSQEAGTSLKRRRTASRYTRPYEFMGNPVATHGLTGSSPLAKRVKRIQGRQPIERMRSNSRSGSSASDI
ncbi:mitosis initiation protein fs(1)Ya [Sabethes cyaneus]|uniref:mitosis initiation protein fs(1)Ya n=1 Tax=Sabethes cyaneus TaxID=53552 RepID=UPI00237D9CC6|nr:mitosis initiation protein fs(1)Ya [Sabethes cyaneus]